MRQSSSYGWGSFWSFIFWCFLIFVIFWWCWSIPAGSGYNFWWWVLIFLVVWWLCDIIFYIPVGVSADDETFRVHRVFGSKEIPMNEIASAKAYVVNGAKRKNLRISPAILSTSFGNYNNAEIGDYEAYYTNPKKTVLITMKDGRKYVVGAKDPQALADYINSHNN